MTITLSTNAWKRLQIISKMSLNNVYYNKFLLSAKSGGCNGFTYNFSPIVNETFVKITNKKHIIVNNNDISVIVDPKSELVLLGTHIDFEKEIMKKSLYLVVVSIIVTKYLIVDVVNHFQCLRVINIYVY